MNLRHAARSRLWLVLDGSTARHSNRHRLNICSLLRVASRRTLRDIWPMPEI